MNTRRLLLTFVFSSTFVMAQNRISIQPEAGLVKYNPMIFGHFIEHFDNQVYGGIFDPGNPLSDEEGFRTQVTIRREPLGFW